MHAAIAMISILRPVKRSLPELGSALRSGYSQGRVAGQAVYRGMLPRVLHAFRSPPSALFLLFFLSMRALVQRPHTARAASYSTRQGSCGTFLHVLFFFQKVRCFCRWCSRKRRRFACGRSPYQDDAVSLGGGEGWSRCVCAWCHMRAVRADRTNSASFLSSLSLLHGSAAREERACGCSRVAVISCSASKVL